MTKTWIFVLTMLFANCAFANAQHEYDSATAEHIQSIYWLSKAEDSAIVYARLEGFQELRALIDQTILAGNISSDVTVNLDDADKLLLMMPEQKTILEVFITNNHLIFNGVNYQLDDKLINKIKAMNKHRDDKGDLISATALASSIERFGRNF